MGDQLRLKLERPRTYRREDVVVSPANLQALDALERWPGWHNGALALVGPEGSGKTHFAQIWAACVGAVVVSADGDGALFDTTRPPAPVLLEDADRLGDEEALFHLINRAALPGAGLLLTSRSLPANWPVRLPDLTSRLNALAVAELGPPDDVILTGVLRNLFRDRNIRASDELLAYLVRRIDRSIPEARRMVERLDEAADLAQRPVNRALARQLLEVETAGGDLFDEL